MAGFYPDVPGPRMAYDMDGSVGFHTDLVGVSQWSLSQLQNANDEDADSTAFGTSRNGLVFPQLRDVVGVLFYQGSASNTWYAESSINTTNGLDGNWVSHGSFSNSVTYATRGPNARTEIEAVSWLGVKGVRFRAASVGGDTRLGLHLYGTIAAGQTEDRLRMWHPTLDEPLDNNTAADGAYLDWGDAARGTMQDRYFRIKNNSSTLTANSIAITTNVLTNTSPTLESQITYSDGGAFAGSLNIGSLAPSAISGAITVRRTTAVNATLALWWLRTIAEAGSWS